MRVSRSITILMLGFQLTPAFAQQKTNHQAGSASSGTGVAPTMRQSFAGINGTSARTVSPQTTYNKPVLVDPTVETNSNIVANMLSDDITTAQAPGYDPTGFLSFGPVTINRATNGENHRAGGMEVFLNSPGDEGCSNGGFYDTPVTRGLYGDRDITGGCFHVVAPTPVAQATVASFVNDSSNTRPQQTYNISTQVYTNTGSTVQGTKVNFTTALTSSVVSQLQVGMVAETNDGFTGSIIGWDPNGAWISVDEFVQIASSPVMLGFNPGSSGSPYTLTVNAVTQAYGMDVNVSDTTNSYVHLGYEPSLIGLELALSSPHGVALNEFDIASSSARHWGIDVGSSNGGVGYVSLGGWNVGFGVLAGPISYAGFAYSNAAGIPSEAEFVGQANSGLLISSKPAARSGLRTYAVDASSGAVTSGEGQGFQSVQAVAYTMTTAQGVPYR